MVAHFAKVVDGVVTDVIVVDNADCGGGVFPESEAAGRAHIASLAVHDPRLLGEWFQTSYNTHNGLHYENNIVMDVRDPETGEIIETNGSPVGAFRLNYGSDGYRFDANAGQYGEFLPPLESE
jgi:hypothetical protein